MQSQIFSIIVHLGAGGGRAKQVLKETLAYLEAEQLPYQVWVSEYAGHASLLAQEQALQHQLVVIGGDGTLHEVVEALAGKETQPAILYLPAGRGNDFARAWQEGRSLARAIERLLAGESQAIPLLKLTHHEGQEVSYALNSLGVGFDAQVNARSKSLSLNRLLAKWGLGKLTYLVAVFASLPHLRRFDVAWRGDLGDWQRVSDCYLCSVLKNPYMGGGIRLDNLSQAQDPRMVLMLFHSIKLRHLPRLIWQILVSHRQDQSQQIQRWSGQCLDLRIREGLLGQLDGEIRQPQVYQLHVEITYYPFII